MRIIHFRELELKNRFIPILFFIIKQITTDTIFPEYSQIRISKFNKLTVPSLEKWIAYLKTA